MAKCGHRHGHLSSWVRWRATTGATRWWALWTLLLAAHCGVAAARTYDACAPNYYGADCDGECDCADGEECDAGVSGDGHCIRGTDAGFSAPAASAGMCSDALCPLEALRFDNVARRTLRMDETSSGVRPRRVPNATIARSSTTPLRAAQIEVFAYDATLLRTVGVHPREARRAEFAEYFSGRRLLPGSTLYSHAYGGHQFGQWAGQLGDGRALSLGELRSSSWATRLEISLKGSGRTPFSRAGDGRAVLSSLCREFLAGVALNALGVPTARALSLVASDASDVDRIDRNEWYIRGGDVRKRSGVLARVAPSFIRFGSIQLAAQRQGARGVAELARFVLRVLADIEAHDDPSTAWLLRSDAAAASVSAATRADCFFFATTPAAETCASREGELRDDVDAIACMLERVVDRVAALIASWQATGFAHGVMNTDNMSILGTTIDLNVFGFLTRFNPSWAPNFIDDQKRYAFKEQPAIALWNLQRLSDSLTGSTADHLPTERAAVLLQRFTPRYERCYLARMRLRLGFAAEGSSGADDVQDRALIAKFLRWAEKAGADYQRATRALASSGGAEAAETAAAACVVALNVSHLADAVAAEATAPPQRGGARKAALRVWLAAYEARAMLEGAAESERRAQIRALVPRYVMRNEAVAAIVDKAVTVGEGAAYIAAAQVLLASPFSQDVDGGAVHVFVEQRLSAKVSTRHAALLQTSCGGQ